MISKLKIRYFDWLSFGLILILLSIGLLFVFSSTCKNIVLLSTFFKKQLLGAFAGIVIYLIFSFIDLSLICRWSYFGYLLILISLIYTIFGGWVGMGAKRWINLYFIKAQPSEAVKLTLPLAFAFYFSDKRKQSSKRFTTKDSIFPLSILIVSSLLVLKQPDLGTSLVIFFSGLILLWVINIPKKIFLWGAIILLAASPIIWKNLKTYQQQRVLVLFGYGNSKKEGYQVEQSKIAIGSGGLSGKGYLKGTQNRLSFLPEARTDFIFSVICEEWGFLGALLVLLLFLILFFRLTYIILCSSKYIDKVAGIGVLAPLVLATVINISMVTGLLPVVGMPLPLLTYGISHLWIALANLGVLNNISIRRTLNY